MEMADQRGAAAADRAVRRDQCGGIDFEPDARIIGNIVAGDSIIDPGRGPEQQPANLPLGR